MKAETYRFREALLCKLDKIIRLLEIQNREIKHMSVELDALVLQVSETVGIEESVIVLLQGIQARIDALIAELEAAQVDTTTLVELNADLNTSELALAEAVANFAPQPPPPTP